MKIAWFSPLPPLKSGISEYSELILYNLKNFVQADLWVDGFHPCPHFYRDFRVIDYTRERKVLPLLKTYDAIVYNIGNNAEFHSGMYEVLQEYPGIVILHDYVLHHFFAIYWINKKGTPERYFQEVRRQYGPVVEERARKSLQLAKPIWESEEVQHYPLNKTVLEKAMGVVVHSEFVKMLLERNCNGINILKLNHPYFPIPASSLKKTREDLHLPNDKVIFASMGFLTPVKLLDKVLQVIARNDLLRRNVFVVVIGESVYPDYQLEKIALNLGIKDQVKFLGYLPLEEAYAYLNCADICLNLRFPTMGETSGSLVRIMSLGKPAVVSNVGWYAELPDDSVIKINPGKELEELTHWLTRLAVDANLRRQIGEAAKNYVLKEHNPSAFVQGLLSFANSINTLNIDKLYLQLLDVVTDVMVELGQGAELFLPSLANHFAWMRI